MFYKKTVLKNFSIFTRKHLCLSLFSQSCWPIGLQLHQKETPIQALTSCEIFAKHLFWKTSAYGCFWTDSTKWWFGTLFLDSRFDNLPDSVILQKHQSFSNQSFKHNLEHMPSLSSCQNSTQKEFLCNYFSTKTLDTLTALL